MNNLTTLLTYETQEFDLGIKLTDILFFWRYLTDKNKLTDDLSFYTFVNKKSHITFSNLKYFFENLNNNLETNIRVFNLQGAHTLFMDDDDLYKLVKYVEDYDANNGYYGFDFYESFWLEEFQDESVYKFKDSFFNKNDTILMYDYYYMPLEKKFLIILNKRHNVFFNAARIASYIQNFDINFYTKKDFFVVSNIKATNDIFEFNSGCASVADLIGLEENEKIQQANKIFELLDNVEKSIVYYGDYILEKKTTGFYKEIKQKLFEYNVTEIDFDSKEIFINNNIEKTNEIKISYKENTILKKDILANNYALNTSLYDFNTLFRREYIKLEDLVHIIRTPYISFKKASEENPFAGNDAENMINSLRWECLIGYKINHSIEDYIEKISLGEKYLYIIKPKEISNIDTILTERDLYDLSHVNNLKYLKAKLPPKKCLLQSYDILLVQKGKTGNLVCLGKISEDEEIYVDQSIYILRHRGKIEKNKSILLYLFFKSSDGQELLDRITTFGKNHVNTLNFQALKNIKIPIFTEEEKKKAIENMKKIENIQNKINKLNLKKENLEKEKKDYFNIVSQSIF